MEKKTSIETVGFISKEEPLTTLKHNVLPGSFVLESRFPFAGYHGKDLPGESAKPEYIYLVTEKKYNPETIARATVRIRKYFKHKFDAVPGQVTVHNDSYPCIRVKDIDSFENLAELHSCFKEEGIAFAKRKNVEAVGEIRVQKIFQVEEISKGLFKDLREPGMYYIEVPIYLNWKMFYSITMNIKNNIDNRNFDAATGGVFRRFGFIEIIRIFDISATMERLQDIQKMYLEEINKFQ